MDSIVLRHGLVTIAASMHDHFEGGSMDSHDLWRSLILVIIKRVSRHNLTLVAAGVAFYALLALFPALAGLSGERGW